MYLKVIRSECLKLRRSPMWLAFFVMPLIPALFGTVNYLNNLELLKSGWYSLWTQHTLFSCYFFIPLLIGVYCAFLWRLEHSGYNWNQTLTLPVPRLTLVLAKLSMAFVLSALMLAWSFVLFILSGLLCTLPPVLPPELGIWFVCGLAGAAVLCAVQLFLALVFRSFAVPVGIALMGGVLGLAMLSKGWGLYCPYSLLSMGMSANKTDAVIDLPAFFISCAVFLILFTLGSALWIKYRESAAQ